MLRTLSIISWRIRIPVYLLVVVSILLSSCGTLEVRIEQTPTPDRNAIATLVDMMLVGTQRAALATQLGLPSTPIPPQGTVRGKICYPSEHIPEMTAYFRNLNDNQVIELSIKANQDSYSLKLAAGRYYAFAWVTEYQVGGMYSHAVPCGLKDTCTDHSPLPFDVMDSAVMDGVDLCDWVIPTNHLPLPPGMQLPMPQTTG